jgi:hypothetical protein
MNLSRASMIPPIHGRSEKPTKSHPPSILFIVEGVKCHSTTREIGMSQLSDQVYMALPHRTHSNIQGLGAPQFDFLILNIEAVSWDNADDGIRVAGIMS